MLINELRDFSKDVPEKKIVLDQLGPNETSRLVMQIAAYAANCNIILTYYIAYANIAELYYLN
jgi:hypothetical protein